MHKFVHLHVHSHYSLLDGLSKIPDLVRRTKELGMDAIALTDHGALYGAIEFYKECKKAGIKPIIGMEAYVAPDSHISKVSDAEKYYHLTLLASNLTGYKNLVRLTTIAHLKGFYYKPRIDKKLLEEHHEGVIALSGCLHGEIARLIVAGNYAAAHASALFYQNLFGKENFYLEVQHHPGLREQEQVNAAILTLSKETGIPIVATADSHYLASEDKEAQDIMLCVQMGKTVNDPNRLDMRDVDVSLRSPEEMIAAFTHLPEAAENSVRIAERCNIELTLGKWAFPQYQLGEGQSADSVLRELAYNGLATRYHSSLEHIADDVKQRLAYELDIISKRGFSTYFLVVADYVNWARNRGIICATRGSAAGSLVSYCIGITTENPLKFRLPFERFLNLHRPTPPDIDMDFADDRRDEVLQYVKEKYGENKVAQICTFGAMMARAAVRDVARALGYPYHIGDRIAKMIPFGLHGFHMTIDDAMRQNKDLKDLYDRDHDTRRIIDSAKKLEGCVRHASVHAAGVVIAPSDIIDFTPLQLEPGGKNIITQYDMHAVEDVGLVKMDFLGVRNLSILGLARDLVGKTKNIHVDLQNLESDDKETYELLARGETMGIFQLSSSGMTRYLKELKPTHIFDIMAMVALYRPGPMNSIPEFIKRKHNPKLISYLDPRLENILAKSYGVLTYQDDVLLIAIQLAGYTWEEADKLRKAMGKKIPAEMAKQKEKFISGCMNNGLAQLKAESLWLLIEPFAAYGFNLAHAASYATIAYQTAYMKAHYTAEYMTAILTAESGDVEKIAEAVAECRRLGIEVLPPSVTASEEGFTYIDDMHIRFGLLAIKNVGTDIVQAIISERKIHGAYSSLEDFLTRVPSKNLNKKSLEAFIVSGALDEFGERNILLGNLEKILNFRREIVEGKNAPQGNLFAAISAGFAKPKIKLESMAAATRAERLRWEKEFLGLYLSDHPFRDYETLVPAGAVRLREAFDIGEGKEIITCGIISGIHKIFSRNGEPMYFVTCDDGTAALEIIIFPSLARQIGALLVEGTPLYIKGKLSTKEGEPKILTDIIERLGAHLHESAPLSPTIDAWKKNASHTAKEEIVQVKIPEENSGKRIEELKKIFLANPGAYKVLLYFNNGVETHRIETNMHVAFDTATKQSIERITGTGSVTLSAKTLIQ